MSLAPLGFGVIGAGGIARRRVLPELRHSRTCRVMAVMDVQPVEDIAREFGVSAAYRTEAELLADPAVEAVYLATPVHLHARQAAACAAAGKHVLCEKPLALTTSEAAAMVTACRRAGVLLREGYMMPFHGAHQKMRSLVREGAIGEVVSIRAQLSCWYPPMPGAWRQRRELGGGGALIDMASHLYHLIEGLVAPISTITALTGNLVHAYETEDASTTLLSLANGAHATVDCFFCIPDACSLNRLEIYGSRGALMSEGTLGQDEGGSLRGCFEKRDVGYHAEQAARNGGYQGIPYECVNPYLAEFDAFAEAIRKRLAGVDAEAADPVRTMRILEAAYATAQTGHRQRLDP